MLAVRTAVGGAVWGGPGEKQELEGYILRFNSACRQEGSREWRELEWWDFESLNPALSNIQVYIVQYPSLVSETHLVQAEIVVGSSWFSGKAGCLASSGLLTAPVDWSPGPWKDIVIIISHIYDVADIYVYINVSSLIEGQVLPDFCNMKRSLVECSLQGFGANDHTRISLVEHLFRADHVLQYRQDLHKSVMLDSCKEYFPQTVILYVIS